MSVKRALLYVLVPIFYLGVIGTFLYLHLHRTDTVSERVAGLELDVVRHLGLFGSGQGIRELEIRHAGTAFHFTEERPVLVRTESSPERALTVKSYVVYPDGVEVYLSSDIRLAFEVGGKLGERMDLTIQGPGWSGLSVPFSLLEGRVGVEENIPLAAFTNSYGSFLVSMPADSRIDPQEGYIHVSSDAERFPVSQIAFVRSDEPLESLHLIWFVRNGAAAAEDAYAGGIESYLDAAYSGWDGERYVRGSGTWAEKGGEPSFTEELGQAWIPEAAERGEYRKATAFFAAAQEIYLGENPDYAPGYLCSPFIGGLEAFGSVHAQRSLETVRTAERMIRSRDPRLFTMNGVIIALMNRQDFSTIDDLVSQLVVNAELTDLEMPVALGMLETYFDVRRWFPEKESYFSRLSGVIEGTILPSLRLEDGAVFLTQDGRLADCLWSLRAGRLLQTAGRAEGSEDLAALGRSVILSVLSLSDELGFLPRFPVLDPGSRDAAGGPYVAPEAVYPHLVADGYMPSEKPLYPVLDPGSWIWSAARVEEVDLSAGAIRLLLAFPAGETHYAMIRGIDTPETVSLGGTALESGPDYDEADAGWHWEAESQSLYLKLVSDAELSELTIGLAP